MLELVKSEPNVVGSQPALTQSEHAVDSKRRKRRLLLRFRLTRDLNRTQYRALGESVCLSGLPAATFAPSPHHLYAIGSTGPRSALKVSGSELARVLVDSSSAPLHAPAAESI